MPPPLPERYRLQIRLERDHDIEQWLGTDTSLDRPVLIRILGPETDDRRRRQFLDAVRSTASINHPHLSQVYVVEMIPDGCYAVSEWPGGSSLADRLAAGDTMTVEDFLPNAAGLASALAAIHTEGMVHGRIDPSVISYAVSHPARMGGLGRPAKTVTAADDVRSLVATLIEGLTGLPPGGPPPSEIIDGLHPKVDRILDRAWRGHSTAQALADELNAAPTLPGPHPESPSWSRRLLLAAAGLATLAVLLLGLGQVLTQDQGRGINVPIDPRLSPLVPEPIVTTSVVTVPVDSVLVLPDDLRTVDPFGSDEENDDLLTLMIDDDTSTVWRSERYQDQLSLIKPGLGLGFHSERPPRSLRLDEVTPGIEYQIGFSPEGTFPTMETVFRGVATSGSIEIRLPSRSAGWWIVWITELPVTSGDRLVEVGEVRFGM